MSAAAVHDRPWVLAVVGVLTYDAWLVRYRNDSLSCHFMTASRRRPIAMSIGVGYVLAHLYGFLPARGDAFKAALRHLQKEQRS